MPAFTRVACTFCKRTFYKDTGHFNENLKLGHRLYCSKTCADYNRTKTKTIHCENCQKILARAPNDISAHNYCSRSCAVKINNQKHPKRGIGYRICPNHACGKAFKGGTKYCSRTCISSRNVHTREFLLEIVRAAYKKLGRVPAKRELRRIDRAYRNYFGSWNNFLIAAGLEPNRSHSQRMYKRSRTTSADGHECDSISEAIVDNWLAERGIAHTRQHTYPTSRHTADWRLGDGTFIEYFGLSKDSPRYDRALRRKRNLCRRHSIRLIEIYAEDVYPQVNLESKLQKFTRPPTGQ